MLWVLDFIGYVQVVFSNNRGSEKLLYTMNAYSRLKWYFFMLRNPILSKLSKRKPIWSIIPHTPTNVEILIALTIGELCTSKSPRYSNALLQILRSVPDDELNANERAIGYFVNFRSISSKAHECVEHCQKVLILCFSAGAL